MGTWQRLRSCDRRTIDNVAIVGLTLGAAGCLLRILDNDSQLGWMWPALLVAQCIAIIAAIVVRRRREAPCNPTAPSGADA